MTNAIPTIPERLRFKIAYSQGCSSYEDYPPDHPCIFIDDSDSETLMWMNEGFFRDAKEMEVFGEMVVKLWNEFVERQTKQE